MLRMVLDHPFFGRAEALGQLTGAVERAAAGRGSYVVVSGEAGIGKTRLVEAATEGRTTWWARATEGGAPTGLSLWNQVVRSARRSGREIGDELTNPSRQKPFGVGEGGHERFLRLDRALEELRALADAGFGVIVLDDLQWADADSLLLLEMLEPELAHLPLVVVATVRSEAVLSVPRAHATMALQGLLSEAIGSIIASVAGAAPSAGGDRGGPEPVGRQSAVRDRGGATAARFGLGDARGRLAGRAARRRPDGAGASSGPPPCRFPRCRDRRRGDRRRHRRHDPRRGDRHRTPRHLRPFAASRRR